MQMVSSKFWAKGTALKRKLGQRGVVLRKLTRQILSFSILEDLSSYCFVGFMISFCTFEKEKNYSNPTEAINITNIKTIKSDDNTSSYIFVNYKDNYL